MTRLLHRQIHHTYPEAVAGDGAWLVDAQGRRYLDASGGAAVSCLGHGHAQVLAAMHAQLDRLAYAHTGFFTTGVAEELAEELAARAPGDLTRIYLVSGGSEAVEAALKLARQYAVETGQSQRRHVIARRQSYHGNTLGALAAGGNALRRAPFAPLLAGFHHIEPCYAYRHRRPDESAADYGQRAADALEARILELGPDSVLAFVAETVVGATLGAVPPVEGYFRRIREICDRHGVLLILDEVMCGMGRTGTLHACTQDGVVPDLMTVAKGLAGGYAPIGAVFLAERIFEAIGRGSGAFQHGHTYLGHPLACAAALAVQQVMRRDRLVAAAATRGRQLEQALRRRFADHPHVGDIRGRGLFWGVELVAERAGAVPFPAARRVHGAIKAAAFARGLIVYPMGGTADGTDGDHVLLAPPFIASAEEIDLLVERLGQAIDEVTLRAGALSAA